MKHKSGKYEDLCGLGVEVRTFTFLIPNINEDM